MNIRSLYIALIVNMLTIGAADAHVAKKCKSMFWPKQFKPYVGAEYQYQHIKANATWHNGNFLPADFNNYNLFVGAKYHPNFGIEFGYYHWINRSQGQNDIDAFGAEIASGPTFVMAQMRMQGWSFDWNAHVQLDPRFNVFALVGMATYNPDLLIITNGGTNLAKALQTVTGKNTAVWRLGLGAEYEEDWWGVRARILWDLTQNMNLNVAAAQKIIPAIPADAFAQSFVVTFGVFYRFFR